MFSQASRLIFIMIKDVRDICSFSAHGKKITPLLGKTTTALNLIVHHLWLYLMSAAVVLLATKIPPLPLSVLIVYAFLVSQNTSSSLFDLDDTLRMVIVVHIRNSSKNSPRTCMTSINMGFIRYVFTYVVYHGGSYGIGG